MRLIKVSICVLGVLCAGSRLSAQENNARAGVDAGNKQFLAAFDKKDSKAIAELYTTDGEAYPPNGNVVRGRAELQKLWQSVMESGIASATLKTTQVESAGDLAYESGTYEMKTKDGKVADHGKYVVVWKRGGGRWMLHRDIWNTNQPPR